MPYNGAIMIRGAYPNELYHHGIKGQKWGVRRFQNPDGTLTAAGKKRYLAYGREGHWDKKEANINGYLGLGHPGPFYSVSYQERKGIWKN